MRKQTSGQILPVVMISLLIMTLMIFGLVQWSQNDSRWAVKQQKTNAAASLAEAGIDRGTWKLQSTSSTWKSASAGQIIAGYNFDTTYYDIPGGSYRIKYSSGIAANGLPTVTITAEGRDSNNREIRALQSIVENQTIYSVMMSGGNVTWARGLGIFWGPLMAQGNIQLMDDFVGVLAFPRKYSKGTVIGSAGYPRDTNSLSPPNTDNVEWWSAYSGIPPVPVLDFVALRSSASASGTLNIYGCQGNAGSAWDNGSSCSAPHTNHFGASTNYIATHLVPAKDYVWFWDGDVRLTGEFCSNAPCTPGRSTSLKGTVVVMGNMTIDTPGDLVYNGHVPGNAYAEENKLLMPNTFDTNATREYPADTGLHASAATFNFGTDTWCQPNTASCSWKTTVGIKGFTYVGRDLTINQFLDFHGAVWVNGNVTASGGDNNHFCGIFYDDTLQVPALNVILLRLSWKEVTPSATAWP